MVKIVTLAYNRSDFIELQLNSVKKWVKDFEYVVYDNCPTDDIQKECIRLGVKCIPIKFFGSDPSWVVGLSLQKMWQTLQHDQGDLVYLDSDMFLIGELPSLEGYDLAFVPQVREGGIRYPWTGLMMFNMDTLSNPHELHWSVDYSLKNTDVGGHNHYYLKKHTPRELEIEMWTLIDENSCSFNGANSAFENINYTPLKNIAYDHGFPRPYSFDVMRTMDKDPFIFHYKSASNYPEFYTPEYNRLKTEALKKFLCE